MDGLQILLVLDFEATCEKDSKTFLNEIIEIPVVMLDLSRNRVIAEFHRYVKPVVNPKLTPFCTELTGITQVFKAEILLITIGNGRCLPTSSRWKFYAQ